MLGIACLLGGNLFVSIPKLMKAAEAKMTRSFVYKTTKQVLAVNFGEVIAQVLVDD